MYKLALSQIVKNEEHVILRQLESIEKIVDALVIVDTGSTDNTKAVITQWASEKNIPLYLYDRPFDNFEDSRNFALDKVKEVAEYAFWLDADEYLVIDYKTFDKSKLDKDLYMFETFIGSMKYTRNECWRTASDIRWKGHVHEYLTTTSEITSGFMNGLKVIVKTDGGSWKDGNIAKKYKDHATVLEKYIENVDNDPRWIFYTAQSWFDSACTTSKEENIQRLERSKYYYQKRVDDITGYPEERFFSKFRVGYIDYLLEEPFEKVYESMMIAYEMDPSRIEPIIFLIEHYNKYKRVHSSYLYSCMGMELFFNKSPFPHRVLFIDEQNYIGKIGELHLNNCLNTNRVLEGINVIKNLINVFYRKAQIEDDKTYNLNEVQKLYGIYQNVCNSFKILPEPLNVMLNINDNNSTQTNNPQINVRKGSNITQPKKRR